MSFTIHPPTRAELAESRRTAFLVDRAYEARIRQARRATELTRHAYAAYLSEISLNSTGEAFPQHPRPEYWSVGVRVVVPWDVGAMHLASHITSTSDDGEGDGDEEDELTIPSLYESILEGTADSIRLTKYRCPEWMLWGSRGREAKRKFRKWVRTKMEKLGEVFSQGDERSRSSGASTRKGS